MTAQKKDSSSRTKEKGAKKSAGATSKNSLKLNFLKDHRKHLVISLVVMGVAVVTIGSYLLIVILSGDEGIRLSENRSIDINIGSNTKSGEGESQAAIIPRRIDGILVAAADANLVPACVMIENAAFGGVRPQSGLSKASVVYELIVEGGITRLMAVYAGEESERVGPVRSARDTYLEFVSEYNCAYYHAGGSFTAMKALREFALRDVDGLRESKYFWRQSGKVSPHNFYTSTDNLYQSITDHSWRENDAPDYDSWNFVDDVDLEENGDANTLARIFYGGPYDVEYSFNEDEGYYERTNGGQLQTDEVTGDTITARNVIFEHVGAGTSIEGKGRINWPVTGEGAVDVFTNGRHVAGTWKKDVRQSRTVYINEQGDEIELARGNTWVSIVPEHIAFEYE